MTMHNIFSCQHDIVILVRAFLQKKFHVMQGIDISIIKPDRIKSVNLIRKILLKKTFYRYISIIFLVINNKAVIGSAKNHVISLPIDEIQYVMLPFIGDIVRIKYRIPGVNNIPEAENIIMITAIKILVVS